MKRSRWIRPAWTPATIVMMVLGFIVFWPLGMAMLAYIIFGRRFQNAKRRHGARVRHPDYQFGRGSDEMYGHMNSQHEQESEEDDGRLTGMKAEFEEFLAKRRQSKNRQDFSRFMKKRREKGSQAIQKA